MSHGAEKKSCRLWYIEDKRAAICVVSFRLKMQGGMGEEEQ